MARHKLSAYLIKDDYEEFNSVIEEDLIINHYQLNETLELEGIIYVGQNRFYPPDWLELLRQGVMGVIPNINNGSTRAVLLIRRQGRIFAFVFGYGRYMLKEESIVRDFGIKVVMNSVNPNSIRSVDTATIDELTIHSRTQTSRVASISAFGIDIARDLMKAVTGKPNNENFGNVMAGRDLVQFSYEINNFREIVSICDYLHGRYTSTDYREYFPWYDNLQIVSDPTILSILNNNLVEATNLHDENRLHLAPPEVIDWEIVGGFSYTPGGDIKDDLLVSDYHNYLSDRLINYSALKRHKVYVWDRDRVNSIYKWSIYNCLVFETEYDGDIYILAVGIWFRIEREFSNRVINYVREIPDADMDLPLCGSDENEGPYNDRVGREREGIITLDRKTVTMDGNQIEICDLLSEQRQFIHIKTWHSSSTLSHLFAQGRVSAVLMLQDADFRRRTRNKIQEIDPGFVNLINEDNIHPDQIEIVFAIIDSDPRELHDRLPFFSKLNMMHCVQMLRNLNFRVSKYKILRE